MTIKDEISETREELDLCETETNLVNNVAPKPEEFDEPSRRNTHFIRPRHVSQGIQLIFSSGLSQ